MDGYPTFPRSSGAPYADAPDDVYDYVIIGSGFGGSVSAWRLTQKGYRVLVLERGKRFKSADFPKTNWNVFKYLWMPSLRCFGIQGLTFFKDLWLLNGSGVGGGSLVYASTHRIPPKAFFEADDWAHLADWEAELMPFYHEANRMLGTDTNPRLWPADHRLMEIAEENGQAHTFEPTTVGIYFGEPGVTVNDPFFDGDGPTRTGCVHCGGCMVGCRHNAKNSLDKNYLYLAERYGAEVRPESNAVRIEPLYRGPVGGARYEVEYEKITDVFKRRRQTVRARNVIVAAGVLGTVDLLLKCRDELKTLPLLSPMVGEKVRSNSEALMGVTARNDDENYSEGVAISSHFWVDDQTSVEPCRYPPGSSFMRSLIWPLAAYRDDPRATILESFRLLFKRPSDFYHTRFKPGWAERDTVLLIMQTVENKMSLRRSRSFRTAFRKSLVTERDPAEPIPACVVEGEHVANRFAEKVDGVPWMGLNDVLNIPNTAHILGGCPMGADERTGVVDINHEAFNYPGLYVADGSVVPANLGVNPSLTITAMTERAMDRVPARGVASPVEPLAHPGTVYIDGRPVRPRTTINGRARALTPLMLLVAVVPLLLALFTFWKRK